MIIKQQNLNFNISKNKITYINHFCLLAIFSKMLIFILFIFLNIYKKIIKCVCIKKKKKKKI